MRKHTTRRRFVQSVGVGGIVGISGCLGDDGDEAEADNEDGAEADNEDEVMEDDEAETDDEDEGEHPWYGSHDDAPDDVDIRLVHPSWDVPADMQWNAYNEANFVGDAAEMYFEEFAKYDVQSGEYHPRGISEWEFGDEHLELTIWDELEWHDGEPFTAEDVHAHLFLQVEIWGHSLGDYVEEIEVLDETTVRLHTDGSVNENVLKELALNHWLQTPHHAFEEYVQRLEDGEEGVEEDLVEWGPEPEEVPGLGPFEYTERDERRMQQDLVEEDRHPDAGEINFTGAEFLHMPTNEDRWAALNGDEVSGVHTLFTEEAVVNDFPEYIEQVLIPGLWGLGIAFNQENEHVGQREVRQAIAHSLDREIVTEASAGPYAMKVETPAGIVDTTYDWIEDIEDELNQYEYDPDRAAELMESVGYEMQQGTWVDDGGDPLEIDLGVPAGFSDWLAGQEATNDLLTDAGFETDLRSPDVSTYWGSLYPDADFAMASQGWTTGQPYPFFTYDWQLNSHDALNIWGVPEEITYEPIYEDGETTVNPADLLDELARTSDEDREREVIHELTALTNQFLPMLPLQEKFDQSFLNVEEWRIDLPDYNSEADSIKWAQFWHGKSGELWATGEEV